MIKKLLKLIGIIQEKTYKDPLNITQTKTRMNPYNPLTYVLILIVIIMQGILYGLVGIYKERNIKKIFIWN
jgi:hypothetical protein